MTKKKKIIRMNRTIPEKVGLFCSVVMSILALSPIFLPDTSHSMVPKAMTPIPPNWRMMAKINVPGTLSSWLTSAVDNPVTVTALIEMNTPSINESSAFCV
ncbi:Uncharacterised protein [Chlamydia trachomatis]|nr:Uncharacterised protein [Chlamydia trachomatis]